MDNYQYDNDDNKKEKDSSNNQSNPNTQNGQQPLNNQGMYNTQQQPFNQQGMYNNQQQPFNQQGMHNNQQQPFNQQGMYNNQQQPFNQQGMYNNQPNYNQQNMYNRQPYYNSPYVEPTKSNTLGIISMICGIIALPGCLTVWLGFIFGVVAVTLAAISRSNNKKFDGFSIAGLVLGILSILLLILLIIVGLTIISDPAYSNYLDQYMNTL